MKFTENDYSVTDISKMSAFNRVYNICFVFPQQIYNHWWHLVFRDSTEFDML